MSGCGPWGPILKGVWQSLQPVIDQVAPALDPLGREFPAVGTLGAGWLPHPTATIVSPESRPVDAVILLKTLILLPPSCVDGVPSAPCETAVEVCVINALKEAGVQPLALPS